MDIASLDLEVFHQIVVHGYPKHKSTKSKYAKFPLKNLYGKHLASWASKVLFSLINKKKKYFCLNIELLLAFNKALPTGKIRRKVFLTKKKVDPESWWKKSPLNSSEQKYSQGQPNTIKIKNITSFQCSFCKYPQLHYS